MFVIARVKLIILNCLNNLTVKAKSDCIYMYVIKLKPCMNEPAHTTQSIYSIDPEPYICLTDLV